MLIHKTTKIYSHILQYCLSLFFGLACLTLPSLAAAQNGPGSAPNVRTYVDGNNVDLLTGERIYGYHLISIGTGGDGLSASVTTTRRGGYNIESHNYWGAINYYASRGYVVSMGNSAEEFTLSGGLYTAKTQSGSTLILSGNIYTYTTAGGAVSLFDNQITSAAPMEANLAMLTSVTAANGAKLYYDYDQQTVSGQNHVYLRSVRNNFSYQLKFENQENKIKAINNRVEYCDPAAAACNVGSQWGETTYDRLPENAGGGGAQNSMDMARDNWTNFSGGGNDINTSADEDLNYSYYSNGRVSSVVTGGGTWSYYYSDSGGSRTTTITDPLGKSRIVVSKITDKTVTSDADALGRTASYSYDSFNRVKTVVRPNGDSTEYTYDTRGNVTETKWTDKNNSLIPIVTTAGYLASCSNPKTCNKPLWTRDARGKQTDYTYYAAHGGIATVTGPAPSTGLARPKVTYIYAQKRAKIKTSAGGFVDGDPVWRLTAIRACPTATSCNNSANETVITQSYRVTKNLFLYSRTVRAGNSSIISTTASDIDNFGNVKWVDGPIAGSVDRSYAFYEGAEQRVIGSIGPDPDGGGALKRRAVRNVYDSSGFLERTESGTATSTGLSALNAMTVQQQALYQYDTYGRRVRVTSKDGAVYTSASQVEYDTKGRILCRASRINKNDLINMPSACALDDPADRITKYLYNATDQVTKTYTAYGTAEQSSESRYYYPNGNLRHIKDGKGNRTEYRFDGFNRHYITYFPHKTSVGSYDTGNYQRSYRDSYGRVYRRRMRDGTLVYFTHDDLGRITNANAPGTVDDSSYTYDLFGRILSTTKNGTTLTNTYDALSRLTSESNAFGTVSYGWNAAGRNSHITYPGTGLFVNYDYDILGRVKKIRENGATSGAGVLAQILYNDKGARTHLIRGNGHITTYAQDGLTASLNHDAAGTADDLNLSFEFNPAGQMTSKTRSNTSYDWDISTLEASSFMINGLNQAIDMYSGPVSYDARGNLTAHSGKSYDYDIFNNLTSVSGTGISVALDYDAKGRLAEENSANGIVQFAYAGTALIAEYDSSNTLLRRYVHGPGSDEPIAVYEGSGTASKFYMMADHQGSIIGYTDSAGTVTDKNSYSPEGVPDAANVGRFGYTGQMWLAEAELYHYKARAYDPQLGRFLQADPIGYGDGLNMYAYVGGDAVNNTDPSGTDQQRVEDEVIVTAQRQRRRRYVPLNPYGLWSGRDIVANANRGADFGGFGDASGLSIDLDIDFDDIAVKAACAVGRAIVAAASFAQQIQFGYSTQSLGGTTLVGLNGGIRAGDRNFGGFGSLIYAQSVEGAVVGQSGSASHSDSGQGRSRLGASAFGSVSVGGTSAPLQTFVDGQGFGVGRAFKGFIGISGGLIFDSDGAIYPLLNIEVGIGTAQEFSVGAYSSFRSC